MLVSQLMSDPAIVIAPDSKLEAAMQLMTEHKIRHLPVVGERGLLGLLSERDLFEAIGWDPARAFDAAESRVKVVRNYMSVPVETIGPEDDVTTAAGRMLRHRIGCLPVKSADEVVGILTEWDIVRSYAKRFAGRSGASGNDPLIHDVMISKPITVDSTISVLEAIEICTRQRVRHLPVTHDTWFVGLISDRDLRLRKGLGEEKLAVGEAMKTDMVTVTPGKTLSEGAALLAQHKFGALPVIEAGPHLVGLLTSSDVLGAL